MRLPAHHLTVMVLLLAAVPALAGSARSDAVPGELSVGEVIRAPGYLETTLPNGLRVALDERRAVPLICATAMVGAGSSLESEDFAGASHFLEHLLFNGTSDMTQEELYDAVDRIGGYNNATTSDDQTLFTMLVPADRAREGIAIQAAMLFDSTLPEEKFDKERKIVLEELARDSSRPEYRTRIAVQRALWPDSPFGRPTLGTTESLGGIGLGEVRRYYRRQYVPGNTRLVIMGDFEAEAMLALVHEIYGAVPSGEALPALAGPFDGSANGTVGGVKLAETPPVVALALPAPGPCDPGARATEVLADVLGGEAGPLRRALGRDRVPDLSVSYTARPRGSSLEVWAELAEEVDPESVLAELRLALEAAGEGALDRDEVARTARAQSAGRLLLEQRIHYAGMISGDALSACRGPMAPLLGAVEGAPLDPEDVAGVAARLLSDHAARARAVVAGPEVEDGFRRKLTPVAREAVDEAAAAAPLVGADVDRTLDNGLRILVAREPGSRVAGLHVLVRHRSAREPAGRSGLADLLHRLLPRGTELSGAAALASRLERIGAELKTADADFIPYDDYYTSPTHSFLRMEVPAENWLAALDLLAELVRIPALDAGEFDALRSARVKKAEQRAASPVELGAEAYRAAMFGAGHPLARPVGGGADDLRAVTHEELVAFAGDYLAPGGLIVSAVTPQRAGDVAAAIAERFTTTTPPPTLPEVPPSPLTGDPGDPVTVELGANQSRLYLGRVAALEGTDGVALRVLGSILSDRLGRTVREEQGLAYRVGATAAASAGRGWVTVSMGTRPDNRVAALEALRAEMRELAEAFPPQDEIDRVRAVMRSRALMRRLTAVNRARYLGLRAFTGEPAADDLESIAALDAVRREDLVRLAAAWLDPDRYRVVEVR